ncbi:Fic family protein [Chlorobium sp. N1]|uniref:Fic family protein n=1 Tax=Chlorobium sp. N1 TaxID=2491138 RepID=UPI00103AA9E6|nr:Fic family protein [Chlorobium sp. N1]TCD47998.1 Fic family protein [Chlorobium sp. N1]
MTLLEVPARLEPCLPGTLEPEVADLAAALSSAAGKLEGRLHPVTAASLADLVRVMNCYYSNLIEGHKTRPRDIELALQERYLEGEEKRNLQLEAVAHIKIQRRIDRMHAEGNLPDPVSDTFIRWLHEEFYRNLPPRMRRIEKQGRSLTIVPGEYRSRPAEDVSVGRHQPPSSIHVHDFMAYFTEHYALAPMGKAMRIVSIAAAHHRFNFIHPFPDGNGRVSRLLSHAMALHSGIGAHGLWSISRGLARGLEGPTDYMRMMDYADMPRQGDLDGRGGLSLKALNGFIAWFLKVSLDQIEFMQDLFAFDSLATRLRRYSEQKAWGTEGFTLLETALIRGEIPRGDVPRITGRKERSARLLLSSLTADGILASDTPKGPVSIRFPATAAETLFPNLFP